MVNCSIVEPYNMVAPAICFGCGAGAVSPRQYFVDTGVQFDYYGALYVCDECLKDLLKICRTAVSVHEYLEVETALKHARATIEFDTETFKALDVLGIDPQAIIRLGELHGRSERTAASAVNGSVGNESVLADAEHDVDGAQSRESFNVPQLELT